MIPSFIRRAKYFKNRRQQEQERVDAIKLQQRIDMERAVKIYEIEKGFHSTPGVIQDYLKLKQEEANYLIAELIQMPTNDPNIARIQGRIKAIHEIVRPPINPKETQEDDDET